MADPRGPRAAISVIALGLAVTAVVVVGIALIVVGTRAPAVGAPPVAGVMLVEQAVRAADVVALERAGEARLVETVLGVQGPRGLRVTDAALAPALGIARGDVVTGVSGRLVRRPFDVQDAVRAARVQRVRTLFVELERDGAPLVVRWRIEGELRDAWLASGHPRR